MERLFRAKEPFALKTVILLKRRSKYQGRLWRVNAIFGALNHQS